MESRIARVLGERHVWIEVGTVKEEVKTAMMTYGFDPEYENGIFNFACSDGDRMDWVYEQH